MQREKFEELLALPLDQGRLLIATHDNPDPDALASAAAMKYLLRETRGIDATAAYAGVIGRAENRAMFDLLNLPIEQLSSLSLDDFAYIALMDAQPRTGNSSLPEERRIDIVIDHHPLRDATRDSRFWDVRTGLGASATIMTEYLRLAGLAISRELATALLYGIRSETQDLGREVSDADLDAYHFLFPLADSAALAAIARPPLPAHYFRQLSQALDQLYIGGTVAICAPGIVTDPDFVPEMADLAVRHEGVDWSLAHGVYRDRIYVSIRTNVDEAKAGEIMQDILTGFGRGGGHGMRAGGNVEIVSGASVDEISRTIVMRFLAAVGAAGVELRPIRDEE